MTRTRATGAALVLAALLAACGGSKGGDTGTANGTTVAGKAGSKDSGLPVWDENRKMNDMSGFSSPLSKAMGFDPANQDPTAAQAKFREREQKRQEGIAECMRAQGFTYTPYVPEDSFQFGGMPAAYELTRKEFVAKYGFGISTMTEEMNGPQPTENGPKPEDDPNFVFQQSLSESDLEAYNKALYGDQVMEEPSPDETSGDGTTEASTAMQYKPQGCQAAGEAAAGGGAATEADQTFMNEFNTKMNALYEKVQADRRVVDANRAYATCMAGKGYPEIDKQQTAYEKVSEKMNPLYESMDGNGPGSEGGATTATVAATPAGGDGGAGFTPPTFDPVKLKEVNTYELGVAGADLACGKDVMKVQYEVQLELEQQFVDENGADLARYKELSDRGVGGMGG